MADYAALIRPTANTSPPEIANADIDDDEADENQRHGKPRFCRHTGACRLRPRGGWAAERGDVVGYGFARTGADFGGCPDTAHFCIITFVDQRDGGLAGLGFRHV